MIGSLNLNQPTDLVLDIYINQDGHPSYDPSIRFVGDPVYTSPVTTIPANTNSNGTLYSSFTIDFDNTGYPEFWAVIREAANGSLTNVSITGDPSLSTGGQGNSHTPMGLAHRVIGHI